MLSIAGKKGDSIEDIDGFENADIGENRLASTNKAEADARRRGGIYLALSLRHRPPQKKTWPFWGYLNSFFLSHALTGTSYRRYIAWAIATATTNTETLTHTQVDVGASGLLNAHDVCRYISG